MPSTTNNYQPKHTGFLNMLICYSFLEFKNENKGRKEVQYYFLMSEKSKIKSTTNLVTVITMSDAEKKIIYFFFLRSQPRNCYLLPSHLGRRKIQSMSNNFIIANYNFCY